MKIEDKVFECLCRGISEETWNKFNQLEKDTYVKSHPTSKYANPEKTLPTQISSDKPNKELLHKYAKIYNHGDDRAYIEKPRSSWKPNSQVIKEKTSFDYMLHDNYDVMELEDGRLLSVEKPRISTSFCAGYGYCGVSTPDEEKDARDVVNSYRQRDGFISENLKENFRRQDYMINKLEAFLNNKRASFNDWRYDSEDEDVYPPLVGAHYYSEDLKDLVTVDFPRTRDLCDTNEKRTFMSDDYARKNPQEYIRAVQKAYPEKDLSLLSKKDAKKYLDMLKRCKADYIRRLENYWNKYQDKHLHTWTYLSD